MTLPLNKTRCPGKWVPNEQTYIDTECSDCKRYLERNTPKAVMFNRPPKEEGYKCTFYIANNDALSTR